VTCRGCAPAGDSNRAFDREQPERNAETDGEHRRDSGRGGRAPGREELRTVRHHLEERLSDGDGGESEQRRASFERHLVAPPDPCDAGNAADDCANERSRRMGQIEKDR